MVLPEISDRNRKILIAAAFVGGTALLIRQIAKAKIPADRPVLSTELPTICGKPGSVTQIPSEKLGAICTRPSTVADIPSEKLGAICTRPPTSDKTISWGFTNDATLSTHSRTIGTTESWQPLSKWQPQPGGYGDINLWELNQERFALSLEKGRNILPSSDIETFLNPEMPLDALFQRGQHLGAGAFGSVDIWTDGGGRSFAIKEMTSKWGQMPGDTDFLTGMALDHENVVRVHHLVTKIDPTNGSHVNYLVMELVDGTMLSRASLTEIRRLSLLQQMTESLDYMLEQGVVPADLHMNNIMVTWDGRLKWIDLGLYRSLDGKARVGWVSVEMAGALSAVANPLGMEAPRYQHLVSMLRNTIHSSQTDQAWRTPLTPSTATILRQFLAEVHSEVTSLRNMSHV